MSEKIFVWTHNDLDGIACCLLAKWAHPEDDFNYAATSATNFRLDFTRWLLKNKISDYNTIYILDLDVSENIDLIDDERFCIVDHHNTHVLNNNYKHAEAIIENYSSAAKLFYKNLTSMYCDFELTPQQKMFVVLADDYDSYKLQIEDSSKLNSIFWATQNNFDTFFEMYQNGFNGFTTQQLAIFKIYAQELAAALEKLEFYENEEISINNKKYHFVSTFADKYIDKVSDYVLDTFTPDVAIVVNLKADRVSFRRSAESDIDLGELAKLIANGGGHAYAAGGSITEDFLSLCKKFKPRKKLKK
jgi:nanoRNase/pAp phosphatase (c-di-AMP/oligoRNAs hydrolase)